MNGAVLSCVSYYIDHCYSFGVEFAFILLEAGVSNE